jgi:hypothetical protein
MSSDLFAEISQNIGYKVLEQRIIPWGDRSNLDCITLLQKE